MALFIYRKLIEGHQFIQIPNVYGMSPRWTTSRDAHASIGDESIGIERHPWLKMAGFKTYSATKTHDNKR